VRTLTVLHDGENIGEHGPRFRYIDPFDNRWHTTSCHETRLAVAVSVALERLESCAVSCAGTTPPEASYNSFDIEEKMPRESGFSSPTFTCRIRYPATTSFSKDSQARLSQRRMVALARYKTPSSVKIAAKDGRNHGCASPKLSSACHARMNVDIADDQGQTLF
jgi:hypothetical protein